MAYQKTAQQIPNAGALVDELTRWTFIENFRRVPGIATDTAIATSVATGTAMATDIQLNLDTNKEWMVAGTNGTSALCTAAVGGGVTLTTAGADNDQEYLLPNTNGALNGLEAVKFDPASAPVFATAITTAASVASINIWAGFLLTVPAPLDYTTDADKIIVSFDTDTDTNFQVRYSVAGTDYAVDTGVTPAASTTYKIVISIGDDSKPVVLIDDAVVLNRPRALTTGANLIPSVGVQALTGAAKAITCRKIILSKDYEDAQ